MQSSVDLTNCDREPIHIPGSIQPHGCLLACTADGEKVLRCSANAVEMLGLSADPVGAPLRSLFDDATVHSLMNGLAKSTEPRRPGLIRLLKAGSGGLFDVAVHSYNGVVVIEFEPAGKASDDALELARALISRTQSLTDRKSLNERVPRYVQTMLGYDRVMLYEFAADGSGKVIGEAKRPHLESFSGQHFPAADIPKPARALYLRNTIRIISDATGPASPVVPELDESGAPLDLSFAHLRSVSPIHLEDLRNMGVAASMSISIIVNGELWGLIACHHYAPKVPTLAQRTAAEMYGDFLSLHLTSVHHRLRAEATIRARTILDRMLAEMSFHENLEEFLRDSLAKFAEVISCDGVGLWMNGTWRAYGSTPPPQSIPRIARLAADSAPNTVLATNALSDRVPEAKAFAAQAAGVLAIPLSSLPRDYLFFFRKEKTQTLEWGGDPNKTYTSGPLGDRLTPRKSFAVWKEIVEGQSDAWTEDDRIVADALLTGLREVILRQNEMLSAERRKAEIRQRVLNDELNHRVKNILALIKALVNQPSMPGESLDGFVAGLRGRILALSHAHDQVVRSDGGGSLHQLLEAELSPYSASQIEMLGDDVGLDARAYSVMALVVHELATNCAKYGALSVPSGRLTITIESDPSLGCSISWVERNGPVVQIPPRRGFGSVLLDRSVPFDLHGTSEVEFRPEGVEARITIPLRFTAAHPPRTVPKPAPAGGKVPQLTLEGTSVLLVEDQLVIALDAEEMLRGLGASKLTTVATAHEALALIATEPPQAAVLDVNLGIGNSIPVAEELVRQGVPFVFATGYGDSVMIPEKLRGVPMVRKPYTADSLKSALIQATTGDGDRGA